MATTRTGAASGAGQAPVLAPRKRTVDPTSAAVVFPIRGEPLDLAEPRGSRPGLPDSLLVAIEELIGSGTERRA